MLICIINILANIRRPGVLPQSQAPSRISHQDAGEKSVLELAKVIRLIALFPFNVTAETG